MVTQIWNLLYQTLVQSVFVLRCLAFDLNKQMVNQSSLTRTFPCMGVVFSTGCRLVPNRVKRLARLNVLAATADLLISLAIH